MFGRVKRTDDIEYEEKGNILIHYGNPDDYDDPQWIIVSGREAREILADLKEVLERT